MLLVVVVVVTFDVAAVDDGSETSSTNVTKVTRTSILAMWRMTIVAADVDWA